MALLEKLNPHDFLDALRRESALFNYAELVPLVAERHPVKIPFTLTEEFVWENSLHKSAEVTLLPVIAVAAANTLKDIWLNGSRSSSDQFLSSMDGVNARGWGLLGTYLQIAGFHTLEYREPRDGGLTHCIALKMDLDIVFKGER